MTILRDHQPANNGLPEGEQLRDVALNRLRNHRPILLRQLMRAFLPHLLDNGPDTSDALRGLVTIPRGIDPRIVGSAIRALAEAGLITSVGRRRSTRPQAHARKIDVWKVVDEAKARQWLTAHPDLELPIDPVAALV